MAFKIVELYDELGEVVERIGDIIGGKVIDENENEYQVFCPTSYYYLPELNINIHYADLLLYDKDSEEYIVQDNIYLVFDRDSKDLVYTEQGGTIQTCIHNYYSLVLKDKTITMKKVDNLDCTYMLDRGKVLDSYNI